MRIPPTIYILPLIAFIFKNGFAWLVGNKVARKQYISSDEISRITPAL